MGVIHERSRHDGTGCELLVSERGAGETREPWRFVSMEFDSFERLTPTELRSLGKWLQQQGRRLGREFKSNGAPRTPGVEGSSDGR